MEAKKAHGYPRTAWLQLGIVYACGIYTAQQQGILRSDQVLSAFWRAHYFDWISFAKRSVKYGWIGGLVAGTVLFGSPSITFRRCQSFYNLWMKNGRLDINATETTPQLHNL